MTRRLLALVLLSCAPRVATPSPESPRDLVVTEDDCEGAPDDFAVSHEAVLADLDVVERVLREGYAGFEARQEEGVDWDATFAALRAGVSALPDPVRGDDLRRYLARGLKAADDNHLSFWIIDPRGARKQSSASSGHVDAWTQDGGAGEGLFLARNPLRIEKRALTLSAASPGEGWRHLAGGPRESSDKPYERDGGVLRLRTLDTGRAPELEAFAKAGEQLRGAPFIVLDLRGNQGGGDGPALDFVLALSHDTVVLPAIDRLASGVIAQGELNLAICDAARPDIDRDTRLEFEKQRDSLSASLDPSRAREWHKKVNAFGGKAPTTYAGPVVLLVDRRCASSCESAVTIARTLPGAVVLGENTAGVGRFGEALEYRLPHSGVWMRAGSKLFSGVAENRGIVPDLWLDDQDPQTAARELAECLTTRESCPISRGWCGNAPCR